MRTIAEEMFDDTTLGDDAVRLIREIYVYKGIRRVQATSNYRGNPFSLTDSEFGDIYSQVDNFTEDILRVRERENLDEVLSYFEKLEEEIPNLGVSRDDILEAYRGVDEFYEDPQLR